MAERLPLRQRMARQDLVRPRRGRIVAGVCVGVAHRFGVSPTLVRVVFLLSLLLPGPQVLAYLALWILMPGEAGEAAPRPASLGGARENG
jgi:phage shock protein PspC (stress-responsive transcriptional regulator)